MRLTKQKIHLQYKLDKLISSEPTNVNNKTIKTRNRKRKFKTNNDEICDNRSIKKYKRYHNTDQENESDTILDIAGDVNNYNSNINTKYDDISLKINTNKVNDKTENDDDTDIDNDENGIDLKVCNDTDNDESLLSISNTTKISLKSSKDKPIISIDDDDDDEISNDSKSKSSENYYYYLFNVSAPNPHGPEQRVTRQYRKMSIINIMKSKPKVAYDGRYKKDENYNFAYSLIFEHETVSADGPLFGRDKFMKGKEIFIF